MEETKMTNNNEVKILDLATRTPTWENIGTDISHEHNIADVIRKANLDYEVQHQLIVLQNTDIVIPNKMATVRTSDNHIYGVTSKKYNIVQNIDAFDFIDYINSDIEFVKAGETAGGQVYIIGKLPDNYILDDQFTPYVIFRNSFDGSTNIQAAIVPLRIVCQNQFNMAFKKSDNTINIRHTNTANQKMLEAKEVLRRTAEHLNTFNQFAENMAVEKITDVQFSHLLDNMFPVNEEEMAKRTITNMEANRMSFMTAYNAEDNANFRGTKWGLINAFSDYQTHKPNLRSTNKSEENRFMSVSFDPTAMLKFMELVKAA